ncbi:unnamed protein product [Mycena citricolor]|uniref:Uncharacterized protein n=1 Tax=Mycena citricolor TaxID=2018698 RepID=A0AAD2H0F9_9AGAR|nr:unnamed protein product [Mycena citricolor]
MRSLMQPPFSYSACTKTRAVRTRIQAFHSGMPSRTGRVRIATTTLPCPTHRIACSRGLSLKMAFCWPKCRHPGGHPGRACKGVVGLTGGLRAARPRPPGVASDVQPRDGQTSGLRAL